jgi:hypothetical protein
MIGKDNETAGICWGVSSQYHRGTKSVGTNGPWTSIHRGSQLVQYSKKLAFDNGRRIGKLSKFGNPIGLL